jgi:hypothetical protein
MADGDELMTAVLSRGDELRELLAADAAQFAAELRAMGCETDERIEQMKRHLLEEVGAFDDDDDGGGEEVDMGAGFSLEVVGQSISAEEAALMSARLGAAGAQDVALDNE